MPQEGDDEKPTDDFDEEADEELEGEHEDDQYQEMVAEMCVLQEDDTAVPEPAEVHTVAQESDAIFVVFKVFA